MYIVNTSFMVDPQVHDRWLDLLTGKYIPVLKENGFDSLVFTRVLSTEAPDYFTYSLQVNIPDLGNYKLLTEELFYEYVNIAQPLFEDKVLWVTSLMKHIEL